MVGTERLELDDELNVLRGDNPDVTPVSVPGVSFADIGGLTTVKRRLKEELILPIEFAEQF